MIQTKKQLITNWQIGSDVEFFLQDINTKKIVTAENIIKGTKKDPFYFEPNNNYYATSLDCVLAEGNIPPCKTEGEFYSAMNHLIKYINNFIPNQLQTLAIPVAELDEDQLQSETACTFGCASSLDCWTLKEVRPFPKGDRYRSAGTHLHIGYEEPNFKTNINIIRAMDLYLGIPSVLIEPKNKRKEVGYGLAGNMRQTRWGAEYRVLSSYFASNEKLIKWCFRNTEAAINFVNDEKSSIIENLGKEISHIINNNDVELAKKYVNDFNIELI